MVIKKVIFYGGKQAGMVALLTLLAKGYKPQVIAEDEVIRDITQAFGLELISLDEVANFDLFVCCHGRKIIPTRILDKGLCINIHPCLYKYKGTSPIKRILRDGVAKASVGCHVMTEKVDEGPVIYEGFKEIKGKNEVEVYNELYPLYSEVLLKTLNNINKRLINDIRINKKKLRQEK